MAKLIACAGQGVELSGVPTEIKILPLGRVHSQKGDFNVDDESFELIRKQFKDRRGEMNTLYRDSIIQVLSTKIDNYRKTDILQPSDDMVLEQDKVIMAGDINVTVRNVVQSARGKE